MNTHHASLLLYPEDPHWVNADIEHTTQILKNIGFIANTLPEQTDQYYVGEKFLDLIAFMGCSPNIRLHSEPESDNFTHIQLINNPDEILFQSSQLTRPPHCPACQKPEKNWSEKDIHTEWICEHCGTPSAPWLYNWRKSAGFAHSFIKITDIYPKEAIPQSGLLAELEKSHGVGWCYFYI